MTEQEKSVLREVDEDVRRSAKHMIRTARFGSLALIDQNDGHPVVSRVGLATDTNGMPIFPVSSLSGRDADMAADTRASLLVGEPGKGDPLAHGRITLQGSVERLAEADHERARRRYLARHPKASIYIDFADFSIWRLNLQTASLNGGFGKAYALAADDLSLECNDWDAWNAMEAGAVEHMNDDHSDANALYGEVLCKAGAGAWRLTGLDPEGLDLALGDQHERYTYASKITKAEELRPRLVELVKEARTLQGTIG
ncbi:MAG: DUF2470 domain-containing protein [Pseudomonadota bacterium]